MKSSELFEILKGFNETKVLKDKALVKVKLKKAVFAEGEISNTDFSSAKLAGADFSSARVTDTKFEKAGIKKGSFVGASLLRALFSGADLSVVKFNEADIKESDFSDAVCEFAEFTSAKIFKSGFVGANCKASNMDGAEITESDFSKADISDSSLKGTKIANSNMAQASLSDINAAGAVFANVGLVKADLSFADFVESRFENCDLTDSSFKYTDISRASFDGCKLENVNFKGAIGLTEEMRETIIAGGGKVSKRPFRALFNCFVSLCKSIFSFFNKKALSPVSALCSKIGDKAVGVCGMDKKLKVKASAYCLMYVLLVVLVLSAIKAFLAISCMAGRCPSGGVMFGGPNSGNVFVSGSDNPQNCAGAENADAGVPAAVGPVDANGDVLDLEHAPEIPFDDGNLELPENCTVSSLASWDKSMCMNAAEETFKFSFDRTFIGDWPLGVFDPAVVDFKRYQTGMAVAPGASIRFYLGGQFKEFRAVATIPPEAARGTKASFLVYLDGKLAYESKVLQHPMTEAVKVDVSGARCMDLKTKFDDGSDNADYLIWGNTICVKQPQGFAVSEPVMRNFPDGLVPITPQSPELAENSAKITLASDVCLLGNSYTDVFKLAAGESLVLNVEPGKYSAFRATVGFNTNHFPPITLGEVQIRAFSGEGQMLFSDYIVFGDSKDIEIDLKGVKQLAVSLEVVKGTPADVMFANAGFVPASGAGTTTAQATVVAVPEAPVVPAAVPVNSQDDAGSAEDVF